MTLIIFLLFGLLKRLGVYEAPLYLLGRMIHVISKKLIVRKLEEEREKSQRKTSDAESLLKTLLK